MLNILAWIILGLLAGAIAKAIYPGRQGGGLLGTMLLGIVGAFVGGFLHTLLTKGTIAFTAAAGLTFGGVVLAVLGAIVTLFIYYAVTKRAA